MGGRLIRGINHVTLSVSRLERSLVFYEQVLGMTRAARWAEGAYLRAGDLWVALLEDPATRPGPLPEYSHLAFAVDASDYDRLAAQIRESGATVFKENRSEGDSLYFLDPDGHKLEIHVGTLESRLAHYRRERPAGMCLDGES